MMFYWVVGKAAFHWAQPGRKEANSGRTPNWWSEINSGLSSFCNCCVWQISRLQNFHIGDFRRCLFSFFELSTVSVLWNSDSDKIVVTLTLSDSILVACLQPISFEHIVFVLLAFIRISILMWIMKIISLSKLYFSCGC